MDEKKFFIFIICILFFTSCRTTTGIHDDRIRAHEVREPVGEVREHQTDQLTQARLSLKKSEKSLEEYERESIEMIAKKEAKIQKKQKEIEGLKIKNYKLKLALVIVSSILTLLILGGTMFLILKMKLKLL